MEIERKLKEMGYELSPPRRSSVGNFVPAVRTGNLYRTPSGRRQIEQMLALLTADRVAKLFYRHVPEPVGSRLQPR